MPWNFSFMPWNFHEMRTHLLQVVLLKAIFGQAFVFRAGNAVVGIGVDADAAAGGEQTGHFYELRSHKADEVLHDDVHAVLVEVTVVTEAKEIEFEAFALDHFFSGDVGDAYFGKVGLSRDGAQASEFGAVEAYPIVVVGMLVDESFEHFGCVVGLILCFASEGVEMEIFAHKKNRLVRGRGY